jgi:hypothetical protein
MSANMYDAWDCGDRPAIREQLKQREDIIRAAEREACAAVCERIAADNYGELSGRTIPEACARAIRARGQA